MENSFIRIEDNSEQLWSMVKLLKKGRSNISLFSLNHGTYNKQEGKITKITSPISVCRRL